MPTVGVAGTVWFAAVNWDDVQGVDRSLVEASTEPVLWVDRGYSPLRIGRGLPTLKPRVEVIREDPALLHFTPVIPPFASRPGLRRLAVTAIGWQTRRLLKALDWSPSALIVTHLVDVFDGWDDAVVRILYGTDDYVAGARLMGLSTRWLERLEVRCVREADLVVAISEHLADKWRGLRPQVQVLPNGCRVLPVAAPDESEQARPPDSTPVVGLVGQLSSRLDLELLEALADAGLELLLVGPVDPSWEVERFARLCRRPGIEYVGRVPVTQLPRYFQRMDVGITPYLRTDFNRASFPLKTLEYLGAGLPVVVADIPASRWLLDDLERVLGREAAQAHIAVAVTREDFVAQVRRLARRHAPELRRERQEYAERHSWAVRIQQLHSLVEQARRQRSH
jgi:teichuronic acid biosynthesis glycosyltransferase TuaH